MNEKIYDTLRDRILFLEYEPGQILNEQKLAVEFGVSRTPLRDVLSRLEWEHLVRILPRTGTMIAEIELSRIMHVFQIRLELEGLIGRLAAENFGEEEIAGIVALSSQCDRLSRRKDLKALAGIDSRLRELFHRMAGNSYLTEISQRLYALTFRLWYITMEKGDWPAEVASVQQDLLILPDSLRESDPSDISALRVTQLKQHIERIRSKFLSLS